MNHRQNAFPRMHRLRMPIVLSGFALAAMLVSGCSYAACSWVNIVSKQAAAARTFDFIYTFPATISVPRDAPAGTIIASKAQTITGQLSGLKCSNSTVNLVATAHTTALSTDSLLMESGIYGVQFRLSRSYGSAQSSPEKLKWDSADNLRNDRVFDQNNQQYTLELVKTVAYPADGSIAPTTLKQITLDGTSYANFTLANRVRVIPQTCQVATTNVVVNMTPPSGLPLRTFTGVGSTSENVPFNIGVNCSGVAAKVFMTLTDQQTPTNTSSVLNLTTSSTVKGLGIQVLYADRLVNFGPDSSEAGTTNQFSVFTSDGSAQSTTNINFSARYIQVDPIVIPGAVANGIATFTMSYQ